MTVIRVPLVRDKDPTRHRWVEKSTAWRSPAWHALCYDEFGKYFRVPSGVKEINVCISNRPVEGDEVYQARRKPSCFDSGGTFVPSYFEFLNENTGKWEGLPLIPRSHQAFTRHIRRRWAKANKFWVWVEY